ncbi:MAG TPA: UpxY family transcription antiterminator [Chitinophagaceae bacterium]|nr:UpxY family transcription antiterminator [Chitinophagaceae bacterium]
MYSITKKWYVVYTRPKWEKKVADQLGRKKIEHYCPLNKVHKQWADRKKLVAEPLFSSYVFVCIDESEQLSVRLTDGIINFVYWLGKPAEVRNDEIQAIRDFLTDYHDVRLEKTRVNPNDIVRVIGGPLVTQKGQVLSVKNKTVKVILPSLGYMMHAEVETSNVEIISKETGSYFKKQQWLYAFR